MNYDYEELLLYLWVGTLGYCIAWIESFRGAHFSVRLIMIWILAVIGFWVGYIIDRLLTKWRLKKYES